MTSKNEKMTKAQFRECNISFKSTEDKTASLRDGMDRRQNFEKSLQGLTLSLFFLSSSFCSLPAFAAEFKGGKTLSSPIGSKPTITYKVNLNNFGLASGPNAILDGLGFIDPDGQPDPQPSAPPLRNAKAGFDWVSVDAVTEAGTTNQLYTAPGPGEPWVFRQNLPAGERTTIRDEGLERGVRHCYQVRTQRSTYDSTDNLCVFTDARIGFEAREMSPEASARVLDAFTWSETDPVPVGDDPDQPALYTMVALVGDDSFNKGIQDLGIHIQNHPIFPGEFPVWDSENAVVTIGNKDIKVWRFVVVPGFVYNAIRERNIQREADGFETSVLVFREIPDVNAKFTAYASHRLNYEYLRDNFFAYNGEVTEDSCLLGDPQAQCPLFFGSLFRQVAGYLVDGIEGLIDGVRQIHGYFNRKLGEEIELTVRFDLQNNDFGFSELMTSGWSGEYLTLEGATIQVRQGFSMFKKQVNDQGWMRRLVADHNKTSICIELKNDAVVISEFLTEKTVCLHGQYVVENDVELKLSVKHPYVGAFAAISDAHRYMEEIMGVDVGRVNVLTGWQADLLSSDGLSYAPCLGSLGLAAGDLVPLVGPLAELALGNVDIVLTTNDVGTRGVPVHEYGHAVMCELMRDEGRWFFERAWTDVISGLNDKSPENEAWVVNEAFADFIASQVLGATNYVMPTNAIAHGSMNYATSGSSALEQNFQKVSNPSLRSNVAHIASILHDLFDGHGDQPEPNDGTHWSAMGNILTWDGGIEDSDAADEEVRLAGLALGNLMSFVSERADTLNYDSFLGGLEGLAQQEGFSGRQVCDAFKLHYTDDDCPNYSGMDIGLPVSIDRPWLTTATTGTLSSNGL